MSLKRIKVVTPSGDQFLSHIFPVPKKTPGDFRIIFDLTELNTFVRKKHFRMDSLWDIMELIRPGDFFISIDLSDAYYCIAIHILSSPFLTFVFQGIYYQFTCLPQGLTSAPRIFTKVMRVVMSFLRSRSIRIAAWIDDFLISASSSALCKEQAFHSIRTFQELGFVPNMEKSQLTPSQRICHLGLVWDSVAYSVSVPADKIEGVRLKCIKALSSRVSVRFLSSILGSIEYFRWGFPHAAVHYRRLQRYINWCLDVRHFAYDDVVSASAEARLDLTWWSLVGDTLPSRSLHPFYADVDLFTDASDSGWGAWTSAGLETSGTWSSSEQQSHINVRECLAVLFGLQCFFRAASGIGILVRCDNTTVVAYINKQGGSSHQICDVALDIWDFCIPKAICVKATYLAGKKNVRADSLSRLNHSDHSYELTKDVFRSLTCRLPFSLDVDCFASRLNFKLPRFFSRYSDPLCEDVDAFSCIWRDNVYLFPPIPIIDRVINKFISDGTDHGVLISPLWPSQPWFSSLLSLLIAPPLLLPSGSVLDPLRRLPGSCQLVAWPIGSILAQRRGYLEGLRCAGSGQWLDTHCCLTKSVGPNLVIGTTDGRLVTVESL